MAVARRTQHCINEERTKWVTTRLFAKHRLGFGKQLCSLAFGKL